VYKAPAILCFVLVLSAQQAWGLVLQDSVQVPSDQRPPDNVIARWGNNASAVAIGSEYLLTVRHAGGGVGSTVTIGGTTYVVAEVVAHTTADLRVVRITKLDGSLAQLSSYVPYNTDSTLDYNYTAVIGGYGWTAGTALYSGSNLYGWSWSQQEALRWGANQVAGGSILISGSMSTACVRTRFDGPSSTDHVTYEAAAAWGDSGGGWFRYVSGSWRLMAITAGVQHTNPEALPFEQSWFDDPATSEVDGDYNYGARLSTYSAWIAPALNKWKNDSDGTWGAAGNWSAAVPTSTAVATFDATLTGTRTVTINTNSTVGTVRFLTDATVRLVGSKTLTFDTPAGTNYIFVTGTGGASRQYIEAPVAIKQPLVLRLGGSSSLTMSGGISGSNSIFKTGGGVVTLSGSLSYTGTTVIEQGLLNIRSPLTADVSVSVKGGGVAFGAPQSLAQLAVTNAGVAAIDGSQTVSARSLALSSSAVVDLGTGAMIVDYASSSPYQQVWNSIAAARNGGAWDKPGIRSSAITDPTVMSVAAIDNATFLGGPFSTFGGKNVDASSVLMALVLAGDIDMSGEVNAADYFYIDFYLDTAGGGWMAGDLDYSGEVNSADYFYLDFTLGMSMSDLSLAGLPAAAGNDLPALLSQQYSATTGINLVPEPLTALLLTGGAGLLLARRRNT
jgi:autotransporter-associated beta strand protein